MRMFRLSWRLSRPPRSERVPYSTISLACIALRNHWRNMQRLEEVNKAVHLAEGIVYRPERLLHPDLTAAGGAVARLVAPLRRLHVALAAPCAQEARPGPEIRHVAGGKRPFRHVEQQMGLRIRVVDPAFRVRDD